MKLFFLIIILFVLISCKPNEKESIKNREKFSSEIKEIRNTDNKDIFPNKLQENEFYENKEQFSNNVITEEIQSGLIRYTIVNGFTPFIIDLPKSYEIIVDKKGNSGGNIWSTNIIKFNEKQIGGIFIGNFEPDYCLWGIDEKDLINIPIRIFSSENIIKIYNNYEQKPVPALFDLKIKYVFETCILNYSGKDDEKYFHVWGETNDENVKNNLIKSFSTIEMIKIGNSND